MQLRIGKQRKDGTALVKILIPCFKQSPMGSYNAVLEMDQLLRENKVMRITPWSSFTIKENKCNRCSRKKYTHCVEYIGDVKREK